MRGRVCAAVVAASAVLAAGCASKTQPGAIVAADAASTAKGTSQVTVTLALHSSAKGAGTSLTLTLAGAYDYARSRGYLRSAGLGGFSQEIRFLPPHAYESLGKDTTGAVPKGKSWLDMAGTGEPGNASLPVPAPGGQSNADPSAMLSALLGVSDNVTQLGTATIRGAQTAHYQVSVNFAKAAAKAGPSARAVVEEFARAYGRPDLPAQVWVDGQNRIRRIQISVATPKSSGPGAGQVLTQTTDYYGFGVPVQVSAPPASKVITIQQLLKNEAAKLGKQLIRGGTPVIENPGPASGTLTSAQARAAEQAVRAFWSALGANDGAAAAKVVLPTQRSCLQSTIASGLRFTVSALHIVSVWPNGSGRALVVFSVRIRIQSGGTVSPPIPGPGSLAVARAGGGWYVDLSGSGPGALPCTTLDQ